MDIHIVSLQKQPPDYQKKNRENHLVNQGNELQHNPRKHSPVTIPKWKRSQHYQVFKNDFHLMLPGNFQTKIVYKQQQNFDQDSTLKTVFCLNIIVA